MAETVRELVREMRTEIRTTDLTPQRACELLTTATALIGNCNDEIREADAAYAEVLLRYLDSEAKANRARIRAETSPEYDRKRQARDTKEIVVEMIGSLKYVLRSMQEEMRLAR